MSAGRASGALVRPRAPMWARRLVCCATGLLAASRGMGLAYMPFDSGVRACPRRQRGQALPLGIFLTLMAAGVMFYMVNTGQQVQERIRLTNTADAVAYSAGVLEARVLNFDAYTNRAMVANQVAIAQMVSLVSWTHYADKLVENAEDISRWFPPVYAVVAAVRIYTKAALAVADKMASVVIAYHDTAVRAMELSQTAIHATFLLARSKLVDEVAKANDPMASAQTISNPIEFTNFTKRYAGEDRGRFRDVTMASRDDFTRQRNWTEGVSVAGLLTVELRRRGGTDLIGFDEWRGMDTISLHTEWRCPTLRNPGRICRSELPLGWGAAEVDSGDGDGGVGFHGGSYRTNRIASRLADMYMAEISAAYQGLPAFRELDEDVLGEEDPRTGYAVVVSKPKSALRTTAQAAQPKTSRRLALYDDQAAADKMAQMARVEVYFERPQRRSDGKDEIGSLFNPYWQVRLAPTTTADRAAAAAFQGGAFLP